MFSDFLLGSQSILILQISADIFHIYIYISDMLLISCCCVSAPACSFGSVSVVTC